MLTRHFPMRFAAIVVFSATLWFILWRQLSGEWSVNDQYSYGWFVPLFALVLFWLRWEDAPKAREIGAGSWELGEQKTEVSGSQDANFTAGGRELLANRPREAGDSVLVKTERSEDNGQRSAVSRQWSVVAIAIALFALALLFPIRLFEIGNPDWRPLS